MSTYGYFMVEVKSQSDGKWERLYWKSPKSNYRYLDEEEKEQPGEDRFHKFVTIGQYYRFRDMLRDELQVALTSDDFSEDTKKDIEEFTSEDGWNEGYFYLSDLQSLLDKKKLELKEFQTNSMLDKIYKKLCDVGDKIDGKEVEKKESDDETSDEYEDHYYEEDLEWHNSEVSTIRYLLNIIGFMVDECFGYVDEHNVRVIVLGG